MLIRDCAALTLLDSSIPEVTETVSSVFALPPLFKRNKPSAPFCSVDVGGLTSLMRSTCVTANGADPYGTTDTVPSAPMLTTVEGGMMSGPLSVNTGNPLAVVTAPTGETRKSPARV
jgi:hypothetical protein